MENGEEKKKKRSFYLRLFLIVGVALLFDWKKKDVMEKLQFEQASTNAVNYVREKYGFEAEVLGEDIEKNYFWKYNREIDQMSLKMKYGDKEFFVYTNRREKSSEGYDDYQLDEIRTAVEAFVNERLPGGRIVSLKLGNEALCTSDLLDTYFDGDNLEEILEKCGSHIEMVFVNTDFSKTDLPKWFSDHNTEPEFTSFDTVEHMNEFLHKMEKSKSFKKEGIYQKYAPYITNYIKISDGRTIRRDVRIQKKDELEYCFFPSAEQKNE